jgi:hypothetical protein
VVDANDVNLFQLLISANHCGQQGEGSTAAFDVDGDGVFTAQDAQAIEDAFGTEECPCDSPFCAP